MVVEFIEKFNTAQGMIDQINSFVNSYGKEVLEYPIYLEQCTKKDAKYKRGPQKWEIVKYDSEWKNNEYFQALGGVGIDTKKKIILISVNY